MRHLRAFCAFSLFAFFVSYGQNNLLDTSTWTVSSGAVTGFDDYGPPWSNVREMDIGPHGTSELIWKSPANNTYDNDGGWNADYIAIDPSKTYRLTVWIKRLNSLDGTSHFGLTALDANDNEITLLLGGAQRSNPYFEDVPPPTVNDWYLLVGFVYGHTHTAGENGLEGIYDTAGNRVHTQYTSYKFASTAVKLRHRTYYRETQEPNEQWFFAPTIYEVNGNEPSIQDLITSNNGVDNQSPSAPSLSSTAQTQTTADLAWNGATDNVGVTGYKIFKDGSLEATLGNVNSYQITGLTAGTSYSFTTVALDVAGNESSASNAVSVTTDPSSGSGSGSSVWTESGSMASYSGQIAVGTTSVPTEYKMAIDGKLITEEVRVEISDSWPDYVFEEGYNLPTLMEIQKHIEGKGHLPNIPSAKEVEANGIELGEMDRLLLEKIEELTLHIIQINHQIKLERKMANEKMEAMEIRIKQLQKRNIKQ